MQFNISKMEFELLINKLRGDRELESVYNSLILASERVVSTNRNKMKIASLEKLKSHPKFNESHKIMENGKTKGVSLKLLLALWEDKGHKLYGVYNDVFDILRDNDIVTYRDVNGSNENVPTDKYKDIIIEKDFYYGNEKHIKLFFTGDGAKVVKQLMMSEGMFKESEEVKC